MKSFLNRILRTKSFDADSLPDTKLSKCLTTTDMALLAIGSMVDSGFDEVSAMLAKDVAGPGVVLAYLLSGLAVYSAALCYAELGVRYPKSGSAYSYMYLTLGELPAFIVGCCLVLERIMVNSAVARSCSSFIDSLMGDVIRNTVDAAIGQIRLPYLSKSLNVLAFIIVVTLTVLLSFGVRSTSRISSFFTVLNITALTTAVCVGAYYSDLKNWTSKETGGFLPYGFSGVLLGSVSCLFAYDGFDVVASCAEEAKNPRRSIPIAITVSILVTAMVYIAVSSVLTLMVNYQDINEEDGLPEALARHGASWAKIIVMIGAFCSFVTALIGNAFSLTRIVFTMADDGLLFEVFKTVNEKSMIPVAAMCSSGAISGVLSMVLDVQTLLELLCVGSLIAHVVVSASVIIIRYRPDVETKDKNEACATCCQGYESSGLFKKRFDQARSCFQLPPGKTVTLCVVMMTLLMLLLSIVLWILQNEALEWSKWICLSLVILCSAIAICFILIALQQQSTTPLRYKVPMVPLVPSISIFVNTLLIANLQVATWIPLSIWIALGLCVYFGYGITHSKLNAVAKSRELSLSSVNLQTSVPRNLTRSKTEKEIGTDDVIIATHL